MVSELQTMMEGTRSLWLFFLLNQMPYCHTDTHKELSTTQTYSSEADDQGARLSPEVKPSLSSNDYKNSTNGTYADCLIDTKMGQIAIGSAGGLIVCLLIATVVLACQICQLQQRVLHPRTSRSNRDLVSGADYWGTDRPEVTGLVGPCDTSVMLEEVRADILIKEEKHGMVEGGPGLEEGAKATAFEENASQMQSSSSRDSCLEVPKDIENMPLVV